VSTVCESALVKYLDICSDVDILVPESEL